MFFQCSISNCFLLVRLHHSFLITWGHLTSESEYLSLYKCLHFSFIQFITIRTHISGSQSYIPSAHSIIHLSIISDLCIMGQILSTRNVHNDSVVGQVPEQGSFTTQEDQSLKDADQLLQQDSITKQAEQSKDNDNSRSKVC